MKYLYVSLFLLSMIMAITIDSHANDNLNAHAFTFISGTGEEVKLSSFKGKVVLIVNTASECTFTDQYAQLQELYDKFNEKGLVIIAVPSNDFGNQEPGSNESIKDFVKTNFNISYLIVAKTHVKGEDAHPFYKWAESQVSILGRPMWNFHKYIINKEGELKYWFTPATKPNSDKFVNAINILLNEK